MSSSGPDPDPVHVHISQFWFRQLRFMHPKPALVPSHEARQSAKCAANKGLSANNFPALGPDAALLHNAAGLAGAAMQCSVRLTLRASTSSILPATQL